MEITSGQLQTGSNRKWWRNFNKIKILTNLKKRRREAEEFLIEFRDKATIGQCRDILVEATQHNGNDAVKFQASAALKAAFPRDCVTLHRGRKYAAVGFRWYLIF